MKHSLFIVLTKVFLTLLAGILLISCAKKDKIDVLLCFSDSYTFQSKVTITSILVSKEPEEKFIIHCFSPDLSRENMLYLKNVVSILDGNSQITFYDTRSCFKNVKSKAKSCACLRLLAPALIKKDKVIYLDTDIVVTGSLKDLWDMNIANYYFAGVVDTVKTKDNFKNDIWKKFGMYDIKDYINSGVLLINLKGIRKNKGDCLTLTMSPNYLADILPYPDQDILNKYFSDKILRIPRKWNWLCYDWGQAPDGTVIFHYAGPIKPWGTDKQSWHLTQNEGTSFPLVHADLWHYYNDLI
jgi:lipopolysaccharide biosynthesis glycosyltransferase